MSSECLRSWILDLSLDTFTSSSSSIQHQLCIFGINFVACFLYHVQCMSVFQSLILLMLLFFFLKQLCSFPLLRSDLLQLWINLWNAIIIVLVSVCVCLYVCVWMWTFKFQFSIWIIVLQFLFNKLTSKQWWMMIVID